MFEDRDAAGRELAARLSALTLARPVVFALPRGGVPVGAVVAHKLGCPLDVIVVRKIGHPQQPELALGAVVDAGEPIVVRNEDIIQASGINDPDFQALVRRQQSEIVRRRAMFGAGRAAFDPERDTAIIVDDGLATGASARAAIAALRQRGARRIILAVPVAAPESLAVLAREADAIVCLQQPERFSGVSAFYADFPQVPDADVVALLQQSLPEQGGAQAPR